MVQSETYQARYSLSITCWYSTVSRKISNITTRRMPRNSKLQYCQKLKLFEERLRLIENGKTVRLLQLADKVMENLQLTKLQTKLLFNNYSKRASNLIPNWKNTVNLKNCATDALIIKKLKEVILTLNQEKREKIEKKLSNEWVWSV